jgi:hypothetical protein
MLGRNGKSLNRYPVINRVGAQLRAHAAVWQPTQPGHVLDQGRQFQAGLHVLLGFAALFLFQSLVVARRVEPAGTRRDGPLFVYDDLRLAPGPD